MKKIWIMAGESSGDMYGAELAGELRKLAGDDGVEISGMGGPKMIGCGIDVKVDSTELGVIGIFEITKMLFTFIRIFFRLVSIAKKERPDAVVLIDYPGFNLLFALAMHRLGIKVLWYVSPHLWVWAKWRLPVLARICSRIMVIFPFETEVFAKVGYRADFTGHPLVDIVNSRAAAMGEVVRDPQTLLLLPGSRKMEISRLLIPMLDTAAELVKRHPELKVHLAAPREKIAAMCAKIYGRYISKHETAPVVEISVGDTGYWLRRAGTALSASGTVTVEAAISGLPLVSVYRINFMTMIIAIFLVKLYRGYFTMVNIIANHGVYEEYMQNRVCKETLVPALERIMPGGEWREKVIEWMAEVKHSLSAGSSSAAAKAAAVCWQEVSKAKETEGVR